MEISFVIVEYLQEYSSGRVTEIANELGLSKSPVHKHLQTLYANDYLTKDGDIYRLGVRYLDVGGSIRDRLEGTNLIKPKVREFAEQPDEVAHFMTEDRGYSVVPYKEVGRDGVFTRPRVGTRLPLNQVCLGKAMLAYMDEDRVQEIISRRGLPAATEHISPTESDSSRSSVKLENEDTRTTEPRVRRGSTRSVRR